jgi:hypothetical protein
LQVSGSDRCAETRELAVELALGIADGEDRAHALQHASECEGCRLELDRLSTLADDLLELAPEVEPPVGFELRALRSLQPRTERRRWWPRVVAVAAAALAIAGATAGGLLLAVRDDLRVADEYRATLDRAHGSSFGAVRLHDRGGKPAGVVFAYDGSPSWVLVTVDAAHRALVKRAELVSSDGRTVPLPSFRLVGGAWGGALPLALSGVGAVHLVDSKGRSVLVAYLKGAW